MGSPDRAIVEGPVFNDFEIAPSRKRIAYFTLHRPSTVADACHILASHAGAAVHAGGINLVSRMKSGKSVPHMVALGNIAALRGISHADQAIHIGAATKHAKVESDPLLRRWLPALADYVAGLGNVRIRMQGTVGGNIMAQEPAYEILPFLCALGADLAFIDWATGRQSTVPASAWVRRAIPCATHLLTHISIPLRPLTTYWNRDLRPAIGLVASLEWQGAGIVGGTAVAIGDRRGPVVIEHRLADAVPAAHANTQAAAIAAVWAGKFPDIDIPDGPSPAYCRHVIGVMLRRALAAMIEARHA
jgi:carbon-monoxide dehydrogenase medium subunit